MYLGEFDNYSFKTIWINFEYKPKRFGCQYKNPRFKNLFQDMKNRFHY